MPIADKEAISLTSGSVKEITRKFRASKSIAVVDDVISSPGFLSVYK